MSRRFASRFLRPSAHLAAVALLVAPPIVGSLAAQEALPRAEIRQVMGGGTFAFSGTGRIKLDRDAFLVVFELGADGRARILYPMTPRERGFARSDRAYYVPLPSADVPFIRASQLSVPVIVAFASDLQPDLSAFTESGRRWDFQYATDGNEPVESTIRGLAELIYGSADMPYSVSTRELSPVLSSFAQRSLVSCGYRYGDGFSSNFNRFLWDLWGPLSLADAGWRLDQIYREIQWSQWNYGGWGNLFGPQTFAFARATSGSLWDQFGAGCDPLARDFRYIAMLPPVQPAPPGGDSIGTVPPPQDRPGTRPPGTVTDVGIELATPADMSRRVGRVSRGAEALAEARVTASAGAKERGGLTRESTRDLVQRQEIERTMFLLTAQRAAGWSGSVNDAFERVRAGQFDNDMSRVASRSGSNRSWTRASGTGSGSTGLRVTGGSGSYSPGSSSGGSGGGGASAGSGSMSGGSEARGGGEARGGSGRGGTGRPGGA